MKKDFIDSKIEAPQDGSQYVFIAFTDPNEPKSSGGNLKIHQEIFHVYKSMDDLTSSVP